MSLNMAFGTFLASLQQEPIDSALVEAVRQDWAGKLKPPNSLGRLEEVALQLAGIQRTKRPQTFPRCILIFAADNGVVAEGVSAYPASVTAQMVAQFAQGGAAICVLARQHRAELRIVDVGVQSDVSAFCINRKVRPGTRNFTYEPALTAEEALRALQMGREESHAVVKAGIRLLLLGEMGIGNTTTASALLALLLQQPAQATTGRGAGLDSEGRERKKAIIERAISRYAGCDPFTALCSVGGLDIAALVGAMLGAAEQRLPVLIDGFIVTVAALLAVRLFPVVQDFLIFAHRSREPGHSLALDALKARPLLDLDLCLGEASGAALTLPLLDSATLLLDEMAELETILKIPKEPNND